MKLEIKLLNAVADKRQYRDNKTGNQQERYLLTLAGQMVDGELISAVVYLDSPCTDVPKSGTLVVLDVYRYEAENALMGNITAKSYQVVK